MAGEQAARIRSGGGVLLRTVEDGAAPVRRHRGHHRRLMRLRDGQQYGLGNPGSQSYSARNSDGGVSRGCGNDSHCRFSHPTPPPAG